MTELRITQFGSYAEAEGPALTATQFGSYAEVEGPALTVTMLGAYAELIPFLITLTQMGAYLELVVCLKGVRIWYSSKDISQWVHSFRLEAAIKQFEVTSLATTDSTRRYVSGIPKWRLPVEGWWDSTIDGYTMPDILNSDGASVQVDFWGNACSRVRYSWTDGRIVRAQIGGDIRSAVRYDYELVLSGAPERSLAL